MVPAPKGWKAAYVTFFALLAIFIPAVSVWTRSAFAGDAPESVKIAAVALVIALSAVAALIVRRLLRT